jgi:glycosyltransferase involved in cell wall biosynthesis
MRAPLAKKSPFKKRVYMRMLERWNLEHAAAIHFTANAEKQEYEEAGLPLRRAVVIPNGLDAEALPEGDPSVFRKKIGIDPDKKIVLSLGRLSWKKGFDTLIPAFAKMAKDVPNAILVIAGKDDEGYMPEMQKLIDASAARSSIVLAGEVEGQERSAAYRSASVFALPSYAENFAGSVAEAMHFGVPVVVSPEVGLAEQVRLSGSGSVVEKDENAVAAELIRLMKDGKSALEMGTRGKAFAATLSYEKVAERFIEVYKEMAT